MKVFIYPVLMLVSAVPMLSSCSNEEEVSVVVSEQTIEPSYHGTTEFLQGVRSVMAKSSRSSVNEAKDVEELVRLSSLYLKSNGFDYSEFFEEGDPRIAMVAFSLSKYDRIMSKEYAERNSRKVGECTLEAIGVKELVDGSIKRLGAKAAAKYIAKKIGSKAVPYLGWGIAAWDFANCMDWL